MNYLPSKELLSEILKENVKEVYEIGSNPNFKDNTLLFNLNGCGELCNINIYELAHMCKEWTLLKGYYFSIYSFNFSFNTEQEHRIRLLLGNEVVYWGNDSCNETEPEAIFQACQWIRDNRS